jgi:hypothetical protein
LEKIGMKFTKMVKPVEEKIKEVVEGKKQHVFLTVYESSAIVEREFNDVAGYQLSAEWVAVFGKDGQTYIFPARNIEQARVVQEV